ncbi:MAG: SDR family oxidoreductase [Candidatus Eisenbacteria bacterium]
MSVEARPSLVLGANGLIGRRLGAALERLGAPWRGTCHRRPGPGLLPLDITDAEQVAAVFDAVRPGVVYHAANLAGGVDFCEQHPVEAEAFIVGATRALIEACRSHDATLVFVSTDYVFDGTRGPYREDDPTHPLNRYGELKLAAERAIVGGPARHVIARTTNVYGWDPETVTPNFLMSLMRALSAGKPVNVPSYLWGSPTDATDLAAALIELATAPHHGLWHVVGSSYLDRYTWATRACAVLGLDSTLLHEVSAPAPGMVPRPLRSWLSTERFTTRCATPLHDLEHGLARMRRERDATPTG